GGGSREKRFRHHVEAGVAAAGFPLTRFEPFYFPHCLQSSRLPPSLLLVTSRHHSSPNLSLQLKKKAAPEQKLFYFAGVPWRRNRPRSSSLRQKPLLGGHRSLKLRRYLIFFLGFFREKVEETDAERAMKLMQQFEERSLRGRNKIEKKVQASQVAFGFGGSSTLKSYGMPKLKSMGNRDQSSSFGGTATPGLAQKEYEEPWDYYSYYPVTLPLRRPYSGNPATLDEQEFGGSGEQPTYDEDIPSPAEDLDLLEENVEPSMFFIQLPTMLPVTKRSSTTEGKEVKERSAPSGGAGCRLEELPPGFMGKMLVYKSGAVKLKLGDTIYNVSVGMEGTFAQDVVAINTAEKQCCAVAEIDKRAILIPDVEAITNAMADL
ncbi:unnamed protein product, partial [Linum tenue]